MYPRVGGQPQNVDNYTRVGGGQHNSFVTVGGAKGNDVWEGFYGDNLTGVINMQTREEPTPLYQEGPPFMYVDRSHGRSHSPREQHDLVNAICKLAACWFCCDECGLGRPVLGIGAITVAALAFNAGNFIVAGVATALFFAVVLSKNS